MRVVSIVNMKGGVGKSTTTVMLAETLSAHHKRSVLIIDLDPQTNATIVLMGPDAWRAAKQKDLTISRYFANMAYGDEKPIALGKLIAPDVSDVAEAKSVDVIPSEPEFRFLERDLFAALVRKGFEVKAIQNQVCELVRKGLEKLGKEYDYVFLDCPPGISVFAEAAIRLSDVVLMPTIPDYVSRLGVLAFRDRALRLLPVDRALERRFFVMASKYQHDLSIHRSELALLKGSPELEVFNAVIPQSNAIASAGEWSDVMRPFERKYAGESAIVRELAEEFLDKVGVHEPV